MDGLLVVDKPAGPTSHDVVARVRRALGERRIGHTGTLDPAATGVLPLVLGRATRLARFLAASDKYYEAVVRLGVATDTYDAEGAPLDAGRPGPAPGRDEIDRALEGFRGTFLQHPPAYSAKKIGGVRSYRLARAQRIRDGSGTDRGQIGDRSGTDRGQIGDGSGTDRGQIGDGSGTDRGPEPVAVTAHTIEILSISDTDVTLGVACSAGFYIRSLAHDLGAALGMGAHLTRLRRTRSGDFSLAAATTLDEIERDPTAAARAVVPLAKMLPGLAAVVVTEAGERRVAQGRNLGPDDIAEHRAATSTNAADATRTRLFAPDGDLIGIAEPAAVVGFLHPSIVLV